ncbi:MAG: hypothetical protein HRT69_15815 [Flavobacteriaceae bacterium]|nr:hypothetical protein [Flavobacteriaceae bacterium]
MAQDIKKLLKQEVIKKEMPKGHELRFVEKLDTNFPQNHSSKPSWLNMAASIILLLGVSYGSYNYFTPTKSNNDIENTSIVVTKTLSDVSPNLKKVEEYYLASINLELSKMKYTSETKALFEDYLKRLDDLNKEYERLNIELTESGPNEFTINALIDNLKFRLNLLYRLKNQLKNLNISEANQSEKQQSI